jgi:hypothetical protein
MDHRVTVMLHPPSGGSPGRSRTLLFPPKPGAAHAEDAGMTIHIRRTCLGLVAQPLGLDTPWAM